MKKYSTLKNKIYDHIRNKECQQSFIKNKFVNKFNLMLLFIFKTIFSDANIVIKKKEIKFNTRSVIENLTSYDYNLLTFTFIENITLKVI